MMKLVCLIVLSFCVLAHGSPIYIVTPNDLTGTEGNGNNSIPFGLSSTSTAPGQNGTARYQQVYAASQFGPIAGGGMISAIAFRPDAEFGSSFTQTVDIRIDLSTTAAGPGGLSLTFANNLEADDTTVFNGTITLSSAFTGPAGGPKNFDIVIPLATPFYYNPAAGNLLMDIRDFNNFGGIPPLDATYNNNPNLVGRVWAYDVSATSALFPGNQDTLGLVTQFTATPVPEPSIGALFGTAAILFCAVKIRSSHNHRRL